MARLIGVVRAVVGEVFAVATDGSKRQLVEGDRVYAGEQLLTGHDGAVAIRLVNGEELTVGRDSSLMLDNQLLAGDNARAIIEPASPDEVPSAFELTEVEQAQQAIAAGIDPTTGLPATAAGPGAGTGGAGSGGGGISFVMLGETAGRVDPNIGYPTGPLAFNPLPPKEFVVDADELPDNGVIIGGLGVVGGEVRVDEDDLPNGTDGSDPLTQDGSFTITALDGIATVTIAGITLTYAQLSNAGTFPLVIDSTYGVLVINGFTGTQTGGTVSYTYTLDAPVENDPDSDREVESFTVVVRDTDGSSASGSLDVAIEDDLPIVTVTVDLEGAVEALPVSLDETTGNSDHYADGESPDGYVNDDALDALAQQTTTLEGGLASLFAITTNYGADGPGAAEGNTETFTLTGVPQAGLATSLVATDGGQVTLFASEDGAMLTGKDEDGDIVLTIEVVIVDGVPQLRTTLYEALDNGGDETFDEAVSLLLEEGAEISLQYEVTRTDGDGDEVVESGEIVLAGSETSVFSFDDDGPTLTVTADLEGAAAALGVELDETTGAVDHYAYGEAPDTYVNDDVPGALAQKTTTVSGGLASLFTIAGSFGSDGEGAAEGNTAKFTLSGVPAEGLATTLVATDGGQVTLYANAEGTQLIGKDEDGDTVLTIAVVTVDGVAQLQTTLYEALDNGTDGTFDEAVSLLLEDGGEISLQYEVTRTDGDGDSIVQSGEIVLADSETSVFSFDDDGPTLTVTADVEGAAAALTVSLDETTGAVDHYAAGETPDVYVNDDAPGALAQKTTTISGGLGSLFTIAGSFGSDGEGSAEGNTAKFTLSGVPAEGLTTTLVATDGGQVTLYANAGGTLLTGKDENGDTVLTIAVVTVDGVAQLQTTLYEALDNGTDGTFDEAVSLLLEGDSELKLQYEVTRTDGDGDAIVKSGEIVLAGSEGSVFSFDDDGPTLSVTPDQDGVAAALSVELDETTGAVDHYADGETPDTYVNDDVPGALAQKTTTLSGGLGSLFTIATSWGSDGEGAAEGNTEKFTFTGVPETGLATTLVATDGGLVTLYANAEGTLLTGKDENGDTVLTIEVVTVDGVAQLQTTLYEALDNGIDGTFDEAVNLLLDEGAELGLHVEVTRTDGDGDAIVKSGDIVLADSEDSVFSFDDDGPSLIVTVDPEGAAALVVSLDETTGAVDHYAAGETPDSYVNDDVPGALAQKTTTVEGGLASLFTIATDYGSDGPGPDETNTEKVIFTGVSADGVATTLLATDGGQVTLYANADGTLLTGKDEDGDTVLTIEIVTVDGVSQLQTTLYEALDNGFDGTFDESVKLLLEEGSELALQYQLQVTRTDGDGDAIIASGEIVLADSENSVFGFDDDGPTLSVTADLDGAAEALAVSLDETTGAVDHYATGETPDSYVNDDVPGALAQKTTTVSGGLASLFTIAATWGSDGEGAAEGNTENVTLAGVPAEGLATTLVATDGGQVTLYANAEGTLLTGKDADGDTVLTIEVVTVDGVPQLQTTLYEALDNGTDGTFDEAVSLLLEGDGELKLQYEVTRTDGDGDAIVRSGEIVLADSEDSVFSFDDDGPTLSVTADQGAVTAALSVSLDETTGPVDHYAAGETPDTYVNDDAPGALAQKTTTVSGGLASLFTAVGTWGSDGEGAPAGNTETFSFSGVPPTGLATTLLATDGGQVTLYANAEGTLLTGKDEDGDTVLTIEVVTVDGVSQLRTTLYEALDNGNDTTFDEAVSLLLEGDSELKLQYEVTLTDGDGDTIVKSAEIVVADSDSSVFSFDDDGPTSFFPDDIHVVLGVEDPKPSTITREINFSSNTGSDGVGNVFFTIEDGAPLLDVDGKQLYLNNEALYLYYDGDNQHIEARTLDGDVAFTALIDVDGDLSITMFSGTFISNTTITEVTDLSGIGGGNVPFKGLNIGTPQDPDLNDNNDVLVSSEILPLGGNAGTVNSSATVLGVGQGNELSSGEVIRYDLVTGLSIDTQAGSESYSFSGYQQTTSFTQKLSVTGGSKDADFKLRIYNTSGSATDASTTLVGTTALAQLVLTIGEIVIYDANGAVQDNADHVALDADGKTLILYDLGDGWTFQIHSVDEFGNPEAFNAVEIEAIESVDGAVSVDGTTTSFKLAEFSYGEQGDLEPVTFGLPVTGVDGDGDSLTSSIDVTVYPDTQSIEGTAGDDVGPKALAGTDGQDYIFGYAGNDHLIGNGGDDILLGGVGNDLMEGGAGRDTFLWQANETGVDTIVGFEKGQDILELGDLLNGDDGSAADIGNLLQYIDISSVDGDTVIKVSASGAFDPTAPTGVAPDAGLVDQTIVLQDVNLLSSAPGGYGTTEASVITGMLGDGTLKVDTV